MAVECAALGPLVVRRDGEEVDLGGPKQRAVLALLLASAPAVVSTHALVEEVWGRAGPADPVRSLQVYVSALRKAIGDPGLIVGTAAGYRTNAVVGDVEAFDAGADRAAALLREGRTDEALTTAREALALWRGPAWQDQRHLRVPALEAHRLDQLRVAVEEVAARAALALGRHREVLATLDDLAARNPLHEGILELRLLALHRCGRRTEALEEYDAARRRLVEETGLDPGETLRRLQAALLADDPALMVEDAELRARRHLPAPVTELVGRRDDVDRLRKDVGEHRLVTLVGPGGVGKTRVAVRVAHEAAADFPDGVWFVDLQAVTDPTTVPEAIADAVGLVAPDDITGALRTWVRDRRALLLLDNFEQVEDAAPLVSELLAAGADLRALVTSRVRLRVYGEHVRRLEPLDLHEARGLFLTRARSVAPWFDASQEAELERLCSALDRLPLALELVAARADEVSLADMVSGLDRPLDLAVEGPRDRTERQQSLRAAISWSVDLLPRAEAAVFGRLGVFVGGFTETAAAAVVGDTGPLTALVRANLLVSEDGRFRMLETIREFATELAGPSLLPVREAHAEWCRTLAAEGVPGMVSDRRTWLPRLRAELGNLRAALAHLASVAAEESPAGVRLLGLATDLAPYWYRATPGSEDVQWLARALAAAPDGPPVLRARAHYGLAVCAAEQGDTERAIAHGREALALLPPGLDDGWRARALNTVAGLTRDLARADEALGLTEEALALRRSLADPALTLLIPLLNLALAATDVGATGRAREVLAEAHAVARDDYERVLVQGRLVGAALAEGAVEEVASLVPEVVAVLRAEDDRYRLIESVEQLAALAALLGEDREAVVLLAATDRAMEEDGARLVPADAVLRERRTGRAVAGLSSEELQRARTEGGALDLAAALDRGLVLCRRVSAPGAGD
ncbi:BTAD domain-containing putative transcriptional regulator [Nocardioides seonyuensis]|uniref:BTAD domain-containing putative transcriptional regulator n=1 Tax=Nocardioides seonyuensis TaxID=2518371 RepID=UPI0014243A95|nr:BTAD domain-containing putative transcriptional regulator [Nocardioides seonyuensis]